MPDLRLAELLSALSLATDLGTGLPLETSGSPPMIIAPGTTRLMTRATPLIVPPVPAVITTASSLPSH